MENYGYTKIAPIGSGTFGSATVVKSLWDGHVYAAKEISMLSMKNDAKEKARNEVRMLAQLDHPNIIRYFSHFEGDASLFIIMEFADGGNLYTRMKLQNGVLLSEDSVLHYFVQVCMALKYLHGNRMLHRDLKAPNVFLTSSGVVKLGDFGIATVLDSEEAKAFTICGTPYYFSPEMCKNRPYNAKSDIWSLGCVLYELSTLKHAFDGTSLRGLLQKIVRGNYPPLPQLYSPDLRSLVDTMLQRNPRNRPSASSVLQMPFIKAKILQICSTDPRIIFPETSASFSIPKESVGVCPALAGPDAGRKNEQSKEQIRLQLMQEEQAKQREHECEQQRVAAEQEQQRRAAEQEQQRVAAEQEQQRRAAEQEQQRRAAELEQQRRAAEQEQQRRAAEQEQQRAMERQTLEAQLEQARLALQAERQQRLTLELRQQAKLRRKVDKGWDRIARLHAEAEELAKELASGSGDEEEEEEGGEEGEEEQEEDEGDPVLEAKAAAKRMSDQRVQERQQQAVDRHRRRCEQRRSRKPGLLGRAPPPALDDHALALQGHRATAVLPHTSDGAVRETETPSGPPCPRIVRPTPNPDNTGPLMSPIPAVLSPSTPHSGASNPNAWLSNSPLPVPWGLATPGCRSSPATPDPARRQSIDRPVSYWGGSPPAAQRPSIPGGWVLPPNSPSPSVSVASTPPSHQLSRPVAAVGSGSWSIPPRQVSVASDATSKGDATLESQQDEGFLRPISVPLSESADQPAVSPQCTDGSGAPRSAPRAIKPPTGPDRGTPRPRSPPPVSLPGRDGCQTNPEHDSLDDAAPEFRTLRAHLRAELEAVDGVEDTDDDGHASTLTSDGSQGDGRVSLMTRIEVLREELEARLGLDCLRAVCRRMEGVRPDDDDEETTQRILELLPHAHAPALPLVLQLLVCEAEADHAASAP